MGVRLWSAGVEDREGGQHELGGTAGYADGHQARHWYALKE